ncbi:unnamed protein product [Rhizoctonia solani]|uniref:Uncharacterized protein n=1 Tax=Rhizoctonia solani TaxID=456999 RepID=A0A8H3GCC6_9AGAM|nr:unnamed protein product [Rhizoctonia solani]
MAACISSRPFTAETPAFDRSWADIMPTGTVVRPADVATRPHQSYSSSSGSSACVESNPSGRLNERTSWFSAKTAVWDPRILLQTIQTQDSEYTLRKAVEWGTKCNSDLSEEEKVDNVLRFLAHAVGLQTAISTDNSSLQSSVVCGQTSHSRNDSTWSNVSTTSFSTSPQSDSASLLDFKCETPVMACRPSPTPSIRSYCMADRDDEDMSSISDPRLSSTASSIPDITSLPSSVCYSDGSDRDRAMEELREVVRNAIAIAEADDSAPLGLAELHAAAREITMARRAREKSKSPPGPSRVNSNTPPRLSTPSPSKQTSKPVLSLDTSFDSATFTPLVRPTTFSRGMSPQVLANQDGGCQLPSTPRMRPNKLYKPRPPSPNDPIPLQTFKTISSPSPDVSPLPRPLACPSSPTPLSLDNCRTHTSPAPESPTWAHGLLKNPFSLRLDVHIITDAISGLGIRKPASPPHLSPKASPPSSTPYLSPVLHDLGPADVSYPDPPIEDISELVPEAKRANSGASEWQYLRTQSGDTDDAPILATPIEEWYLPQFTPITENAEGKQLGQKAS